MQRGAGSGRARSGPSTVLGVDLHTLITWLLTLAVLIVLVVRTRAKRKDRRRDAEQEQTPPDRGRSLY